MSPIKLGGQVVRCLNGAAARRPGVAMRGDPSEWNASVYQGTVGVNSSGLRNARSLCWSRYVALKGWLDLGYGYVMSCNVI